MSEVKRKLATILATDCVGFSKHMESQEEKTLINLKACRDIIDPLITKYGGRIFHTAGDSVIAEFDSPVQSVKAAIEFQKFINNRNKQDELDTKLSIFETGIKVVDLLAPYRRGGKIGLFGGAGVGKTVLIMELIVRFVQGEKTSQWHKI